MKKINITYEALESTQISVFEAPISNTVKDMDCDIFEIYECIKGALSRQTKHLRSIKNESERDDYKKNNLPYCTFSGAFASRSKNGLIQHSNLICIDIDDLPADKFNRVRMLIIADPSLIMCFTSPSGNGLKVIYPIDINLGSHEEWYNRYIRHVTDSCYVDEQYIDKGCKDVARACFLCNDPDVFLNPEIKNGGNVHPIDFVEKENFPISYVSYEPFEFDYNEGFDLANRNSEQNFKILMKNTDIKMGTYRRGQRHNWVVSLAGRCNALGMAQEKCLTYSIKYLSNHPESVIKDNPINILRDVELPIKKIYNNHVDQFNTWLPTLTDFTEKENENTQLIPAIVYDKLPTYLKNLCSKFADRDRDVFFVGLLGVLSACFKNVSGVYHNFISGTNLYTFISAPAGSGKGIMKWAEKLVFPIHDETVEYSQFLIADYEQKINDYKEDKSLPHPGKEPKLQMLLIPANTSSTGILQTIADNEGNGLMFETEADTLSATLSKEWGDFSEFLRKAFHHETVSYKRRTKNEYIQIKEPRFSMVLSGTPQQVLTLISSTENGLFSRFAFYTFKHTGDWKNPFEDNGLLEMENFIQSQSIILKQYFNKIKAEPKISFRLTPQQQDSFNETFTNRLANFDIMLGGDIAGSVYRLGSITFRIAMLLSIFRMLEIGEIKDSMICNDEDFEAAMAITDVLKDHTAQVYQSYKVNSAIALKPEQLRYFQALPNQFERKQANDIATQININLKTAEKYLGNFKSKNLLFNLKHGFYSKKETN